mgnify:CR=1 FL=1
MSNKKYKPSNTNAANAAAENVGMTGMTGTSNQHLLEQLFERQRSTPVQSLRSGGMFQELQYPLLQNRPGAQPGALDRYNLRFRDKSGLKGSTGQGFLNKAESGSKWNGLRLDHGPNAKAGGRTNWHWNQKGAMNAFGHADQAQVSPGTAKAAQGLKYLKPLSRGAMVVGAGMDAYSIGSEAQQSMETGDWQNTIDETARVASGWTGAYMGAKGLGTLGAGIGTMIAPGIGTMIGGGLGGLIGGAAGYFGMSSLANWATEKW